MFIATQNLYLFLGNILYTVKIMTARNILIYSSLVAYEIFYYYFFNSFILWK